jgi:GNAT superfamily N-acetyltransferase
MAPVTLTTESRGDPAGVRIRAIRADDKARIVKAFGSLEPRSIRLRFFSLKKNMSAEEVRHVTEPDRVREAALVATVATEDREEIIVGLGQYAGSGRSADIAFVVEEDYQNRGIASRLLQHLVRIARERGITQFEADVLAGNTPMLTVLRRSRLPRTESEEDGVVRVTLALAGGTG